MDGPGVPLRRLLFMSYVNPKVSVVTQVVKLL